MKVITNRLCLHFSLLILIGNEPLTQSYTKKHAHTPFPVENNQSRDQKADEEDDGDRDKDHGVENVFISCLVKHNIDYLP